VRFGGLRTVAFDGLNSLKAPDTDRNRAWLGRIRYRMGFPGYPTLRLMTLVETGHPRPARSLARPATGTGPSWPAACHCWAPACSSCSTGQRRPAAGNVAQTPAVALTWWDTGEREWAGAGSNRRPSAFQADARTD
jgi:hypothetical protein